jgi:hypothetical protein
MLHINIVNCRDKIKRLCVLEVVFWHFFDLKIVYGKALQIE